MARMGTRIRMALAGVIIISMLLTGCPPGEDEIDSRREGRYLIVDSFPASRLDNTRRVTILLPESYDVDGDRRYPVLYVHDGQNLFDAARSVAGTEWEVDESVDSLVGGGLMAPVIVVGIDNTPDRILEYTPSQDPGLSQGGRAADYAHFVVRDLKPWVDERIRTLPGRENTGLAGSSLGGLVSLYMLREYPEVFGRIGCASPSLWWNENEAFGWADQIAQAWLPDTRIWLDVGTAEGDDPDGDGMTTAVADARDLRDQFLDLGLNFGEDLGYLEGEGDKHNETAWARRLPNLLYFLFSTRPLPNIDGIALRSYSPSVQVDQRVPLSVEASFPEVLEMSYPSRLVDFGELTPEILGVDAQGYAVGLRKGVGIITATIDGSLQIAECQIEVAEAR